MTTKVDKLVTEQNAMARLARGSIELINQVGVTIAASGVKQHPTTDPIDTTNHKRVIARLSHDSTLTDGKLTLEFSDTQDFTNVTFFETINLNITSNPPQTKVGVTIGADVTVYCADIDVESMDVYMRARVRNDTVATCTYSLNARGKVN